MRRLTLNNAYIVAESQDRQCLSTQYTNNKDPLLWHYSNNHEWYAPFYRLKNHNKWYSICDYDKRRLGNFIAKEIALRNNRKCISDSYINNQILLIWECDKSYQWQATLNSIKNNDSWYSYCIGTIKLNLEVGKQIALSKQRQCLSTKYINIDKPLFWICQFNHQWQASLNKIKNNGAWCSYYAKVASHTIKNAKKIALS